MDRRSVITAAAAVAALSATRVMAAPNPTRIYYNPLKSPADVKDWVMEGAGKVDFELGRMRLTSQLPDPRGPVFDPKNQSNFVFWNPEVFPDEVEMRWNFTALNEPGLAIFFFGTRGILPDGSDCHVLDKRLKPRGGQVYDQYTKSDLSSLQIAYFRRRWPEERALHLSNLRRAPGFDLLAQGGDPLPDVADATPPYRIRLVKRRAGVEFYINDLLVVGWRAGDPGPRRAWPGAGSTGLRQMAPLVATYSDFEVFKL
jgi:hypothetical protein